MTPTVPGLNASAGNVRRLHDDTEVTFAQPVSGTGAAKLHLPAAPSQLDPAAQARWLTSVFNLNPARPIVSAEHQGVRGAAGHVVLRRFEAAPIRFEPASRLNTPARLVEDLDWQKEPGDGESYAYKTEHARQIVYVVRMLCGASKAGSDQDETAGIVSVYLQGAQLIEGLGTYGGGSGRYEAAAALQRDVDDRGFPSSPPKYLIDKDTGEYVVRLQDLSETARRYVGSSLARGWLDARMTDLGWPRVRLDGHAISGRDGRGGHHLRCDVYRGHLPTPTESVTT